MVRFGHVTAAVLTNIMIFGMGSANNHDKEVVGSKVGERSLDNIFQDSQGSSDTTPIPDQEVEDTNINTDQENDSIVEEEFASNPK
jgi:hypothetical protein